MRFYFSIFLIGFFSFILTEKVGLCDSGAVKQLYDSQKYQEALDEINHSGFQGAADYYNAGNCYFKLNKLSQAYAYYLKANALSRSSEPILHNLNLTKDLLNKTDTTSTTLLYDWLVPWSHQVSWNGYFLFFVVINLLLALCLRSEKLKGWAPVLMGLWLFTLIFGVGQLYLKQINLATIAVETSTIRSGPKDSFAEISKLSAGSQVEITGESREGWKQIRFGLGNLGWIVEKDLLEL